MLKEKLNLGIAVPLTTSQVSNADAGNRSNKELPLSPRVSVLQSTPLPARILLPSKLLVAAHAASGEPADPTARSLRSSEGRALLPAPPCSRLPALVQRQRQDDDDEDHKHQGSNDEEDFSEDTFLSAVALNGTFWTLLVSSS